MSVAVSADVARAHVVYEISMFLFAFEKLISSEQHDAPMRNLLTEAVSLHARNLIEFFYFARKADYIRATDVGYEPIGRKSSQEVSLHTRASVQIVHIGDQRQEEHQWHFREFRHLIDECGSFLRAFQLSDEMAQKCLDGLNAERSGAVVVSTSTSQFAGVEPALVLGLAGITEP
jgi:hypothetical protein